MKLNLLKTCVPLSALLLLSGCIDDNYDLSDIDKTTQINVNDLVIPVNIDAIELSQIISLNEDSKIKIITIDGKEVYAVTQTGDFNSDPIEIDGFQADAPVIADTEATFDVQPTRAAIEPIIYKLVDFNPQKVDFNATNIDASIKDIEAINTEDLPITISLQVKGEGPDATLSFPYIVMDFLKGLTIKSGPNDYTYDAKTGKLTVKNLPVVNNMAEIKLVATAVDFIASNTKLVGHDFNFRSSIQLSDGEMEVVFKDEDALLNPKPIVFDIHTEVADLVATAFTGVIKYDLEGESLDIDPVVLNDMPDFLSDEKTELLLANPQIYLDLNNPMATFDLGFQTGLQLTAIRGLEREDYSLDNGQLVRVGYNYGVNGPYNYVISPSMPAEPLAEYNKNLTHVGFKSLSNVLEGEGLPQSIEIALINPELPEQHVTEFKLFNEVPGVKGKYEFFAPLALKTGENSAKIYYTGTEDGWASEDLDKMTITHLEVSADAFSNLPLGADVTIHPIDRSGMKIPNLTVEAAHVPGNAEGQPITLKVSGEIHELAGIIYEAVVTPDSEEALSPQQTLRLENIKAKVTGFYLTDFN